MATNKGSGKVIECQSCGDRYPVKLLEQGLCPTCRWLEDPTQRFANGRPKPRVPFFLTPTEKALGFGGEKLPIRKADQ